MADVPFEAEQTILATLLAEPGSWDDVADVLRPEHFYVEAHRHLAAILIDRIQRKESVEPVALLPEIEILRAKGRVIPTELPLTLAASIGTTSGLRVYVEIVRDHWVRRSVLELAHVVLHDQTSTGAELAAKLAQGAGRLETAHGRTARRLSAIIAERADLFEAQQRAALTHEPAPHVRIPTGFRRLDKLIGGIPPGEAVVVAARPGVGKTALESALADNFAAHGVPTYILQLEGYGESLADRAIARRARINTLQMRDATTWTSETWGRFEAERQATESLPIWIDDQHGLTPLDVAGKMRRAKRELGIRMFMLDVFAELDVESWGGARGDERLDRLLGRALALLRDTAHDLEAGLLVFLHLNRELERRSDPTPRLSDIKNSGEIEDKAYMIWFLSRPEKQPGSFVIDVAKHRDGPTGIVTLDWLGDYMCVSNPRDLL